jgi:TolA-binding protein
MFLRLSFIVLLGLLAAVLGERAALADPAADDQYAVAAGHYAGGRWQLAAEEFAALVQRFPDHPRLVDAHFFRAEALVQVERYAEARQVYRELLAAHPQHPRARRAQFRAGEAALLAGEVRAAREELAAFNQQFPEDPLGAYVLPYLGDLHLETDPAAAARHFEEALTRFPEGPLASTCRLGRAKALVAQQLYQPALDILEPLAASGSGPEADEAHYELGQALAAAGRHADAVAAWSRLESRAAASPWASPARLAGAWSQFKLDRLEEAEQALRGLVDDPRVGLEASYRLGLVQKAGHRWAEAANTLLAAAARAKGHELHAAIACHAGEALLQAERWDDARGQFLSVEQLEPAGPWVDEALWGLVQLARQRQDLDEVERLGAALAERFPRSPLACEALLARAASRSAQQKYDAAAALLRQAPGDWPAADRARCQAALGMALARQGLFDQSREAYRELAGLANEDPLVSATARELAEVALAADQRAWAAELFGQVAEERTVSGQAAAALSGLAWTQFRAGNWREAAATLERLLSEHPGSPLAAEALLLRGQCLEKLEQLDLALALYRQLQEQHPRSEHAGYALWHGARLQQRLSQFQEAEASYRRLAEEHPKFPQLDAALYAWAALLHKRGQVAEAESLWQRVRREFPRGEAWGESTYRLAQSALDARRFDEAQTLSDEVLVGRAAPAVVERALYLQGRLALARQKWDDAAAPLARLVHDFPQGPLAWSARYLTAEARYRQEDYAAAADAFTALDAEAAGGEPRWRAMVRLRRAQSLAQLKDWNAALQLAETLAREYPDFDQQYEADYLIGRCLASQADFDAARAAYQRSIAGDAGRKTETAALAQWMIGESYFHQENYPAALREYLKVEILYAYPRWQAAALLQAGKCQEQLEAWSAAAALYARLIKEYPQTEVHEEARRRLSAAERRAAATTRPRR